MCPALHAFQLRLIIEYVRIYYNFIPFREELATLSSVICEYFFYFNQVTNIY